MVAADVQSARRPNLTPPPASPRPVRLAAPQPGPLAQRLAAVAEREAYAIIGYRVRPTLFGPLLWALHTWGSGALLRDRVWLHTGGRLRIAPGDALARAILIHWLDREPPICLVERFRARFFGRLMGPEFTVWARDLDVFLAAQGVLR